MSLGIQVEAETTVEGVLQNLKNYQPPMLKREELRGKKGKDDDFNGAPLLRGLWFVFGVWGFWGETTPRDRSVRGSLWTSPMYS